LGGNLWTTWSFDPGVVALVGALGGGYALLAGRRGAWRWPRAAAFYGGLAAIVVALCSVIDAVGDCCLLTVHMVQHEVLLLPAPILLLWGCAGLLSPPEGRLGRALGVLTRPGVSVGLLLLNLYAWHLPAAYDATLRDPALHATEHLLYLLTSLLFWWTPLSLVPPPDHRSPSSPSMAAGLLHLLAAAVGMMPLGVVLLVAGRPFYPFYAAAPKPPGWSALFDQQMAGAVMLAGNAAVLGLTLGAGLLALFGGPAARGRTAPRTGQA
jgi:putative membrane protein